MTSSHLVDCRGGIPMVMSVCVEHTREESTDVEVGNVVTLGGTGMLTDNIVTSGRLEGWTMSVCVEHTREEGADVEVGDVVTLGGSV